MADFAGTWGVGAHARWQRLRCGSGGLSHSTECDELIALSEIVIEPVTTEQARIAREAHGRDGRGVDDRARLNFGDCFAYAPAKVYDEPLLFVGNDFTHTDLRPAISLA